MKKELSLNVLVSALTFLVLGLSPVMAAHFADVDMRDATGEKVTVSGKPYSPKMTCGAPASTCHVGPTGMVMSGGHNYESDIALSTKTQIRRDLSEATYQVPYPQHGVTAGYHFQQGKNIDWSATQKAYYGLPSFTSAPAMYGKY